MRADGSSFPPSLPFVFSPFHNMNRRGIPAGAFSWLVDKRAGQISVISKKK